MRISVRRSFLDKDFRFLICKTPVLILKSYCHRKVLKPIQELGTEKGPKWSSLLTCLSWDIEPNPSRDFHRSTLTCPLPTLCIPSSFPSYSLLRLFDFKWATLWVTAEATPSLLYHSFPGTGGRYSTDFSLWIQNPITAQGVIMVILGFKCAWQSERNWNAGGVR